MGSPGCGKTTAATAVGHRLGTPVIDVDDYLENFWKTSVAAKVHNSRFCLGKEWCKFVVFLLFFKISRFIKRKIQIICSFSFCYLWCFCLVFVHVKIYCYYKSLRSLVILIIFSLLAYFKTVNMFCNHSYLIVLIYSIRILGSEMLVIIIISVY